MKQVIRIPRVQGQPVVGNTAFSFFQFERGYRYNYVQFQSTLPAGANVTDCHDRLRLSIGKPQIEINVSDYDRYLAHFGAEQGIQRDVPGDIADIMFRFSEPDRSNPGLVESGGLDLPLAEDCDPNFRLPDVFAELEFKSRAATVPTLGAIVSREPLSDIPKAEWNVVRNGKGLVTDLLLTKIRSAVVDVDGNSQPVNENFQAFQRDELEFLMITAPDGNGNAAVLNQVIFETNNRETIWDITKKETDAMLRRHKMFPGADFMVMPTLFDRSTDTWNLRGKTNRVYMQFTDALGGPQATGVNRTAPVGAVKFITGHRGGLD